MKNNKFLIIITVLWLFFLLIPASASIEITTERLTTSNGLADNSVRCIYQDNRGFLWFGTVNGLSRYDGNSFINYFPGKGSGLTLADRRIRDVGEDKNGFLWVSTYSDLFSCFDLKTERFVDFTGRKLFNRHYKTMQVIGNDVWLSGDKEGLMQVTYRDGIFHSRTFSIKDRNLPTNRITFVQASSDSKAVYIGTDKGLYAWKNNRLACLIRNIPFETCVTLKKRLVIFAKNGAAFVEDKGVLRKRGKLPLKNGDILTGIMPIKGQCFLFISSGCFVFTLKTGTIVPATVPFALPAGRVRMDNVGNFLVYNYNGVCFYVNALTGISKALTLMNKRQIITINQDLYHIAQDHSGIVWITTHGNGLYAYRPVTDELQHFTALQTPYPLFSTDFLKNIVVDRTGGIWVTSEYNGLSHLTVTNQGVVRIYPSGRSEQDPVNMIRMLTQTGQDVWAGTREGCLYQYDTRLSRQEGNYQGDMAVYAFFRDTDGNTWKGTRGQGLFINGRQYRHNPADPSSLADDNIYTILRDRRGRMWIGTFGRGLELAVPSEGGYRFRHFLRGEYGQRWIRCMVMDKNGWIWVGTSGGVFVFNPDELVKDPTRYYTYQKENKALMTNEIHSLFLDRQGHVYIAESGAGMSICTYTGDYGHLKFIHYDMDDGLINNKVQAFAEDKYGRIWISTDYGISCFEPARQAFSNYFFSSSMPGDVYQENCGISLSDGRVAFGSSDGIVVIDPSLVVKEPSVGSIVFTDLKLNGISVRPGDEDSPLKESLSYTKLLRLAHDQNSLTIEFSTLDFSEIQKPKYSFYLEGYEQGWSIPSPLNFAAYKNLSPGTYVLHVRACNASGEWSKKEAVLVIEVLPPFWKTPWAYLIYLVLTAIVLYAAFRIIRNFNTLHNKIKVEKQLTEYKLVFFTNISHEFRTPLTLIRAALEKLESIGRLPADMSSPIKLMDKSTCRMLRLVNQLIEFRKMQHNKLSLSLEKVDIISFLQDIFTDFEETAADKHLTYELASPMLSCEMYIDKEKVDKIVYNLLSNALKYTPDGGRVELSVTLNEASGYLIIKVVDNGVGIPKEKQSELFKRFMQTHFSANSMGVGLHLTYELVKVHKGHISYQENPGGGSVFTVTLPVDKSVYQASDFLVSDYPLLQEPIASSVDVSVKTPEELEESPLNEQHILIIEDDKDIRELIAGELSNYFHIETAGDGNTGLKMVSSALPDLIICDVLMPGYSGFEVTKRLKYSFATSHIPVILLTALSAPEKQLEGVESGADAYITKPFSMHFLKATVLKLIEQRRKLKEKFTQDLSTDHASMSMTERDNVFAERLQVIVRGQMNNARLSIDDLAVQMNLGRTAFYAKVKGVTGYSPAEFIKIVRMKEAAKLLLEGNLNISEIAFQVGINDPFYFSRCFKSQFGVSPSAYKKGKRKDN